MTGLDEYTKDGDGQQKSTHISFQNPEHSETSVDYAEPERMQKHFDAAKALKEAAVDRKLLVGDFVDAVKRERVDGDEGAIEDFLQKLQD